MTRPPLMNPQGHASEVEIDVVHEASDFCVINKPSGLAVHNGPVHLIGLVEDALGARLNPVHRLDRETSGLILLARGPEATTRLQRALGEAESEKEYLAVVRGAPAEPRGDWSAPVSPKAEGRKSPAGAKRDRVHAHTQYQTLEATPWLTLLSCRLFTGRQHQIRKHTALEGCHIVGDRRYGDPKHARMIQHRLGFNSLALHAARLVITDQGVRYQFESSPPESWRAQLGFQSLHRSE